MSLLVKLLGGDVGDVGENLIAPKKSKSENSNTIAKSPTSPTSPTSGVAITCECGTRGHIGHVCDGCGTTVPDLPWITNPILTAEEAAEMDAIRMEGCGFNL